MGVISGIHLRRLMRSRYRGRRDALVETLVAAFPEASVHGIAAGLHATVRLTADDSEDAIREQAGLRRIAIELLSEYTADAAGDVPTLLLGYAQMSEPAIRAGVVALADAVDAARQLRGGRAF